MKKRLSSITIITLVLTVMVVNSFAEFARVYNNGFSGTGYNAFYYEHKLGEGDPSGNTTGQFTIFGDAAYAMWVQIDSYGSNVSVGIRNTWNDYSMGDVLGKFYSSRTKKDSSGKVTYTSQNHYGISTNRGTNHIFEILRNGTNADIYIDNLNTKRTYYSGVNGTYFGKPKVGLYFYGGESYLMGAYLRKIIYIKSNWTSYYWGSGNFENGYYTAAYWLENGRSIKIWPW